MALLDLKTALLLTQDDSKMLDLRLHSRDRLDELPLILEVRIAN